MSNTFHYVAVHDAMKLYVSTAIDVVAQRVDQQSSNNEDAFFFARLTAMDELRGLPEYELCFKTLRNDSVIASQTEVLTEQIAA